MTSFGRPIQRQRNRTFKYELQRRLDELPKFPVGVEIRYRGSDITSLGKVMRHDLRLGRLETDRGGSHSPLEVEILATE